MTLKAYMVFSQGAGPQEGAALVFANTVRQAKRLGFSALQGWFDAEWTDIRIRCLREDAAWLAEQESVDLEGDPTMIESPKGCARCELWGNSPLDAEGICERCLENEEVE